MIVRRVLGLALVIASLVAVPAEAATKTPKGCAAALKDADSLLALEQEHIAALSTMFTANKAASDRATATNDGSLLSTLTTTTQFIRDLTAATQALTAQTNDIATRTAPVAQSFFANEKKCRAGK